MTTRSTKAFDTWADQRAALRHGLDYEEPFEAGFRAGLLAAIEECEKLEEHWQQKISSEPMRETWNLGHAVAARQCADALRKMLEEEK